MAIQLNIKWIICDSDSEEIINVIFPRLYSARILFTLVVIIFLMDNIKKDRILFAKLRIMTNLCFRESLWHSAIAVQRVVVISNKDDCKMSWYSDVLSQCSAYKANVHVHTNKLMSVFSSSSIKHFEWKLDANNLLIHILLQLIGSVSYCNIV